MEREGHELQEVSPVVTSPIKRGIIVIDPDNAPDLKMPLHCFVEDLWEKYCEFLEVLAEDFLKKGNQDIPYSKEKLEALRQSRDILLEILNEMKKDSPDQ